MNMAELTLLYLTYANVEEAKTNARGLVNDRLAARGGNPAFLA